MSHYRHSHLRPVHEAHREPAKKTYLGVLTRLFYRKNVTTENGGEAVSGLAADSRSVAECFHNWRPSQYVAENLVVRQNPSHSETQLIDDSLPAPYKKGLLANRSSIPFNRPHHVRHFIKILFIQNTYKEIDDVQQGKLHPVV
jgi:hypothetical protein